MELPVIAERTKWDRDLESLGSHIVDPRVSRLLEYWLSKRGNRRTPFRTDIDPTEIPGLLPSVFLMDVDRPGRRFKIRLAGTAICDAYHRDITGEDFEDVVGSNAYKSLHSDFCEVVFSRNIHYAINNFDVGDGNYYYERILLPLSNCEDVVDILIGLFITTFKSEDMVFPLSRILSTAEAHVVCC